MSGIDIKKVEEYYKGLKDSDLIRIATQEVKGIRPEVIDIIKNELEKRNLSLNILKGAEALNKTYTITEISELSEKLRILPCPICGSTSQKLNGTTIHKVISHLIITHSSKEPLIACPDCLDKKNKDAFKTTLLFGWWGFPWGIIKTPIALLDNYEIKKIHRNINPNKILLSFTLNNIGEIEAFCDDSNRLKQIISVK